MWSISAAKATKLTCWFRVDSRSPLRSSFCSRSSAANRLVLMALFLGMASNEVVGSDGNFLIFVRSLGGGRGSHLSILDFFNLTFSLYVF